MRQVKKCCRPIPILLTMKIQKTCKGFRKAPKIKTRDTTAAAKPEVTTINKKNDWGINDRNNTRETELK